MKISLIVEGKTEKVFVPKLREYLRGLIPGDMPLLHTSSQAGRIPKREKLNGLVESLLRNGRNPSDHVIALTDVYPDYSNADEAKSDMRQSVKDRDHFHPHAAQYEFEAWLLPYVWNSTSSANPELINNNNPPSKLIKEIFRQRNGKHGYVKARDADRILRNQDLNIAIQQCPELKSLVNTILKICGGQEIP